MFTKQCCLLLRRTEENFLGRGLVFMSFVVEFKKGLKKLEKVFKGRIIEFTECYDN